MTNTHMPSELQANEAISIGDRLVKYDGPGLTGWFFHGTNTVSADYFTQDNDKRNALTVSERSYTWGNVITIEAWGVTEDGQGKHAELNIYGMSKKDLLRAILELD